VAENLQQEWMDFFALDGKVTQGEAAYAKANAAEGLKPPQLTYADFMSGERRDAFVALKAVFDDYGLSSLVPVIADYIRQGYGADTINIMLRDTKEYKQRFAANEDRAKAGLSTLSPAEYIAMERQYAQTLRAAGMPTGFYDSTDDFRNWIAGDVSANEVQQRVAAAKRAVFDAPEETRKALYDYYGVGVNELAAYFLDEKRAMPVLEKQLAAADIGGAASRAGFNVGQDAARRLADLGVSAEQANQGYQQIGQLMPDASRLSDLYGATEGRYDLRAAEAETFGAESSQEASATRKRLASRERAEFSGSSGARRGSLSRDNTAL